ncbi:hypothetical protein GCM10009648_19220 [Tsukamurella spumae]
MISIIRKPSAAACTFSVIGSTVRGAVAYEPVSGLGIPDGSASGVPATVVEQPASSSAAPTAAIDLRTMDSSSGVIQSTTGRVSTPCAALS